MFSLLRRFRFANGLAGHNNALMEWLYYVQRIRVMSLCVFSSIVLYIETDVSDCEASIIPRRTCVPEARCRSGCHGWRGAWSGESEEKAAPVFSVDVNH